MGNSRSSSPSVHGGPAVLPGPRGPVLGACVELKGSYRYAGSGAVRGTEERHFRAAVATFGQKVLLSPFTLLQAFPAVSRCLYPTEPSHHVYDGLALLPVLPGPPGMKGPALCS